MKHALIPALAALALAVSGCVGLSRSSAIEPASAEWAAHGRIQSIDLVRGDLKGRVGGDFNAIFRERVQVKLNACARGSRPLVLRAEVEQFYETNPVITAVVAGRNKIRGKATLIDAATGQVVGRYIIGKTIVGGRFAVLKMGQAEEQLSDAFGEEVCRQAFRPHRP